MERIKLMNISRFLLLSATLFLAAAALCQNPSATCVVPEGVSLVPNVQGPAQHAAEIVLKAGARPFALPNQDEVEIEQVCGAAGGRLFVYQVPHIVIIDIQKAAVVDNFPAYHPSVSPDGKWIVYQKYYPRSTELPASSVYMRYDLSKTAAGNRPLGMDDQSLSGLDFNVGTTIYPAVLKDEDGDNVGLVKKQRHQMRQGFFWSSDSKAVVFIDEIQRKEFVVMIQFGEDGTTTPYATPFPKVEACIGTGKITGMTEIYLSGVDFGPEQKTDRVIMLSFKAEGGCAPKSVPLHRNSFDIAKPVVREYMKPEDYNKPDK
jgi:hypothetical protein